MENKEIIKFNKIKFLQHPIYKDYLASKCGKILSLKYGKKKDVKITNE